jgi:hypothetical protein
MPDNPPLTSAGSRDSDKRPAPIPKAVKEVIRLMVYGTGDDALPMGFVEASKLAGVRPDQMRRWLDKPAVINFIRSERRAWRLALCSGNETALQRIRDGDNAMASVQAVKALEAIDAEQVQTRSGVVTQPGISIVIQHSSPPPPALPGDTARVIDAEPVRQLEHEPEPPAERSSSWISIDEIQGRREPHDESHHTPIEGYELERRLPDADDRPEPPRETLDQFKERLLAGVPRLAPASMGPAPLQPYDKGYKPPPPRGGPRASRYRQRRGDLTIPSSRSPAGF